MKTAIHIIVVTVALCISATVMAQKSIQDLQREFEESHRAAQRQIEQSQLRLQQMEADTARRQLELERLRLDTDRLRMMNEAQDASDKAKEYADRAEQAASEQTEAAKKAQEAAEDLQDEMEQAAIRTRNHIYLGIIVLSIIGLAWSVVRKSKGEEIMKDNEKFGISTVIGSILIMVLAVMISDEWAYRFDLLQNLMTSLKIRLFAENGCTFMCKDFLVDFPTKYAVLACLCSAAYGFTTYLDITPIPKIQAKVSDKIGTV